MKISKTRDQHIYDELFRLSADALGYRTYSSMPPEGTTYPFVKIGEIVAYPYPVKGYHLGTLSAQIEVWAHGDNRIDASTMAGRLEQACKQIGELDGAYYSYNTTGSSSRILPDNSTTQRLWRAIITAEFLILK